MNEKLLKQLKRKFLLYSLILTMAVGFGKCSSDVDNSSLEQEVEEENTKVLKKQGQL